MNSKMQIRDMRNEDIDQAVRLWVMQYKLYCANEEFPQYWAENQDEIKAVLEFQIQDKSAIVAEQGGQIIGFLGFFKFDFHNEKTALCNVTSHGADELHKERVYHALYTHISKQWVHENILNHLWMFFDQDTRLKTFLYDMGFGSYVLDGYAKPATFNVSGECPYPIRLATPGDLTAFKPLVDESLRYYEAAPLFLKRDYSVSSDYLQELIARNNIFIALDGSKIIGFININRSPENDTENLSTLNCGLIDELGAYIQPEYRSKNLGAWLLNATYAYCRDNSMDLIHVDFETANSLANRFWRKYFTPMILSVRRPVNKDAII